MNSIKSAAGGLDGLEPGEGVWEGIKEGLEDREAKAPSAEVKRGPMVRLILGWSAALATVLVVSVWLWPRPAEKGVPNALTIVPAAPATEASAVRPAVAPEHAPVPAGRKRVPAARRESRPPRETRYLVDDLASAKDLAEPEARIRYMLPVMAASDLADGGSGQHYIMPAVHAAVREPF